MISLDVSYIVVALAPHDIAEKYMAGKKRFGLWIDEDGKDSQDIILLNFPHITLKYPFFIDSRDEDKLIDALKFVKFKSFSLNVKIPEVFHPKKYGNVLVARPLPSWDLQHLHEDIYSVVRPVGEDRDCITFEGDRFTPHLSFLYGVPDADLVRATKHLEDSILPYTFDVSKFYLLKTVNKEKSIRTIVSTYPAI